VLDVLVNDVRDVEVFVDALVDVELTELAVLVEDDDEGELTEEVVDRDVEVTLLALDFEDAEVLEDADVDVDVVVVVEVEVVGLIEVVAVLLLVAVVVCAPMLMTGSSLPISGLANPLPATSS